MNKFQTKYQSNLLAVKGPAVAVCSVEEYRNPTDQVYDFLEKAGYYMAKTVAEYFEKTDDLHSHYVQYETCIKAYNSARRKSFKFLMKICEEYFLPVPDINMTFEDMQFVSIKDGFVQGFIDKYYQSDFCLVGDTQQVKRLHRKLDKLSLKKDLNELFVNIANGIDS